MAVWLVTDTVVQQHHHSLYFGFWHGVWNVGIFPKSDEQRG